MATQTAPQLSEPQQAWLELLNTPGVYPDGVDAIGEPDVDENDNAFVTFQDGKKLIKFTILEDGESYESQILNPEDLN